MSNFQPGMLTASSPVITIRELALAADRSLWAGDQNECIAITARIYDLFDALQMGLEPDLHSRSLAAETAAWISGRRPRLKFSNTAHAPG